MSLPTPINYFQAITGGQDPSQQFAGTLQQYQQVGLNQLRQQQIQQQQYQQRTQFAQQQQQIQREQAFRQYLADNAHKPDFDLAQAAQMFPSQVDTLAKIGNMKAVQNSQQHKEANQKLGDLLLNMEYGNDAAVEKYIRAHPEYINDVNSALGDPETAEDLLNQYQSGPDGEQAALNKIKGLYHLGGGDVDQLLNRPGATKQAELELARQAQAETKRHNEVQEQLAAVKAGKPLARGFKPPSVKEAQAIQNAINITQPAIESIDNFTDDDIDNVSGLVARGEAAIFISPQQHDRLNRLNTIRNTLNTLGTQAFKGTGALNIKEFDTVRGLFFDPKRFTDEGVYKGTPTQLRAMLQKAKQLLSKTVENSQFLLTGQAPTAEPRVQTTTPPATPAAAQPGQPGQPAPARPPGAAALPQLPQGTVDNGDGTFTLPDGRRIRQRGG